MKLRHLEAFLIVAEELHFGRAAARLHVAQPAVSQTISALEEDLGVQLFDRSNRRVRLTAAGQAYVAEVRGVFAQLDHASSVARDADAGLRGRITVAYTAVCTLGWLPTVLVEFMRELPEVVVQLQQQGTAEQVESLNRGSIDVGFSILAAEHGPVHAELVAPDELHLFFRTDHPFAARDRIPVAQALHEPFLLMSRTREPCVHRSFQRMCDQHGTQAEIVLEVDHLESMLAFVGAGLGVSLAPSVASTLSLPGVTSRPLDPHIPAGISAIWSPETMNPTTERFLAFVRART